MKKQAIVHWILPAFVLLGLYFFTRLIAIRTLPPFNDEFIYVRWAQEGFFDSGKRLLSFTDGKQPLFIWLTSLMMNVIHSPMAAGRIVSILAGVATMIGLGVFSYQLFKNRFLSFVAAFLYILSPFALVLDRFALYDSLLAALSVWSMIVMYILVQRPTLGIALVLALVLGAALLTKSSALLILFVLPLGLLLWTQKRRVSLPALGYFALAVVVAFLYQSVQLLSADVAFIAEKNSVFLYTWQELRSGFSPVLLQNLSLFGGWILSYVTPPVLLLAVFAFLADRPNRKSHTFLLLAFLLPFGVAVATGKTVYPRHLFFETMPLLILAAAGLAYAGKNISKKWLFFLLCTLCLLPSLYASSKILADFKSAPIPEVDRFQYIEGWPAGWGVKEIVRYIDAEARKGELTVVTEGTFGSLPTTIMQLYFRNYPQVHIVSINDATYEIPLDIDWAYHPVYAILNKAQEIPIQWTAEELLKIQKGNGNSFIRLLRVTSGR